MRAVVEFFLGLRDPVAINKMCIMAFFCLNMGICVLDYLCALVPGAYYVYYKNIYDLPVSARVFVMSQITWPTIVSAVQCLIESRMKRQSKRRRNKCKGARLRLAKREGIQIRPVKCRKKNSPKPKSGSLMATLTKIYPVNYILSCQDFIEVWRTIGKESAHLASPEADVLYHQWKIQQSQLPKIKYFALPRLLGFIVLTIFDPLTVSRLNPYMVGVSTAMSILSITMYFCLMARLPGQIVFNHLVLTKKDSLNEEMILKLQKSWISCIGDLIVNALYLGACYCVMLGLAFLSWKGFVLTISLQLVIVGCAFLYCYCCPSESQRLRLCGSGNQEAEKSGCSKLCAALCAFGCSMWTTCGYLIAPHSLTSLQPFGRKVSFFLRFVATAVYASVFFLNFQEPQHNADQSAYGTLRHQNMSDALTTSRYLDEHDTVLHVLLLVFGGFGGLFLNMLSDCPIQKYLPCWEKFLSYRDNSLESLSVLDQYCNHCPCWFCEMIWCAKDAGLLEQTGLPSDRIAAVPFIANENSVSANLSASGILGLLMLANVPHFDNAGLLLCPSHAGILEKFRQWGVAPPERLLEMGKVQLCLDPVSGRIHVSPVKAYASVGSMIQSSRSFSFFTDMHEFLRYLYSPNMLDKRIPHQMLYKAFFYDGGIRDPLLEDAYWKGVKRIQEEHGECGDDCELTVNGQQIDPVGANGEPFSMNLGDDQDKIQNFMAVFHDEHVSLMNATEVDDKRTMNIHNAPKYSEETACNIFSSFLKTCDQPDRDYTVVYEHTKQKLLSFDDPG